MIFEHQSKNKKIVLIAVVIILLVGLYIFIWPEFISKTEKDNSDSGTLQSFGNDYIEKAITDYLLTQDRFSWKNRDDGINLCSIENLNPENELFPLYIWVYCAEYILENGELKTVSGSSGPAKINYPNELSYYSLDEFSYEVPGDGSQYAVDIKTIFPKNVQQRILNFDRSSIIQRNEILALDYLQSWELIKKAIDDCQVQRVWQLHNKSVGAELKNGQELSALEPKIDDIIKLVEAAESQCGEVPIMTE